MRIRESRRFSRENIAERVNPSQTPLTSPINTPAAAQKWQIGAEDIAYRPCRRCGRKRVRALGLCRLFSSDVETLHSLPCGRGDHNRGHAQSADGMRPHRCFCVFQPATHANVHKAG